MNKFIYHKVLPFVCTLSIIVSLMVPVASAAGVGVDEHLDTASVSAWQSAVGNDVTDFVDEFASFLGVPLTKSAVFWRIMDGTLGTHLGEMDRDTLELVCTRLNNAFGSTPINEQFTGLPDSMRTWFGMTLNDLMGFGTMHFKVQYPSGTSGYYRIEETVSGIPVVNSKGMYPCTLHESLSATDGAPTGCKFVPISYLKDKVNMMPYESLYNLGQDYGLTPMKYDKYWILKKSGTGATDFVLADSNSYPCVARYEEDKWASNQDRPTTNVTENGDVIEGDFTDNSTNIDMEGMTITLPDGSINFIDKIIYDESTKSYHIDSHDTYNYTTNNYYTWNYYINYTSITYIGQTEEYNKYYEVYYELPDGRDSADLTKEDLEQLNLSIDVIPYGRSADDTSLRSLYHFDGDTKDSSYWNYCTEFEWRSGASLTYMDAGVFDGALYLDETMHEFYFHLPSNTGTSDFTMQFRYYQSATETPNSSSGIWMKDGSGWVALMKFTGAQFLDANGTALCSTPIGTWNEIALIRKSGVLYYYVNGVCVGNLTKANVFTNIVDFYFTADQQTFKYLDEFRFIDECVYDVPSNYECTAVPHDTNLTLVLPDSKVPVADEYWVIDSSRDNLLSDSGWDYFDSTSVTPLTISNTYNVAEYGTTFGLAVKPHNNVNQRFPYFSYYTNITAFHNGTGGHYLTLSDGSVNGYSIPYYTAISTNQNVAPTGGIFMCLARTQGYNNNLRIGESYTGSNSSVYTLSMVDADANVCSVTIDVTDWYFEWDPVNYVEVIEEFNGYRIGFIVGGATLVNSTYSQFLWAVIQPIETGNAGEITYLELTPYEETDLTAEFVESVTIMDKADLNTPTLAVRTDLDITSYQIGGVRPSIPEKGQVWAMVENDRIVSIQIYNGQAWEGVDGRIWTGQRWIPASSYNIITLQDMYDIVDATPNYEYIYSEAGFWAWWQKSWNAFQEKLFQAVGSGGSGGGSIVPGTVKQKVSEALSSLIEGIFGTITEVLKSLIGAASDLLSGIFSFFSDTVFGGIHDFFSSFDELINPFETTIENEDGSTTTAPGLPDDVVTGFGFFSGLIMLIPDEVRVVLFFFAGLTLFIAILKRFA